jgi:hypothetical protein
MAYEEQRVEPKIVEATTPIDIRKKKITCEYCGKPNHTTSVCRKKVVGIKIALREELAKEGCCFKCGKQGYIARMCNVKKVIVLSEENKNTSTYSSLKKEERKEESIDSPQTQESVLVGNASLLRRDEMTTQSKLYCVRKYTFCRIPKPDWFVTKYE